MQRMERLRNVVSVMRQNGAPKCIYPPKKKKTTNAESNFLPRIFNSNIYIIISHVSFEKERKM